MRAIAPLLIVGSLLVATACTPVDEPGVADPNLGGQFGEETGDKCELIDEVELGWDEESPLGFTPNDLADLLVGDTVGVLTWVDGSTTGYAASLAEGASAFYRSYEQVDDGSGAEIDYGCGEVVAIELSMQFSSDEGALDESWDLTLESGYTDVAGLTVELDDMTGSLDIASFSSETFDETWADLTITFDDEEGPSGEIVGYGESRSSGSGSGEGTVTVSRFDIATF